MKTKNDKIFGWTENMKDIHYTFCRHNYLLLFLIKLNLLDYFTAGVIQKDFEQNIWAKIRDGDYPNDE